MNADERRSIPVIISADAEVVGVLGLMLHLGTGWTQKNSIDSWCFNCARGLHGLHDFGKSSV